MSTDRLDGLAASSYDNGLLRLTLDEQRDSNVHRAFVFAKLLHFSRERIRKLLFQELEGGFSQVLHDKETQRLRANVLGIEFELAFREKRLNLLEEALEPSIADGYHRCLEF